MLIQSDAAHTIQWNWHTTISFL